MQKIYHKKNELFEVEFYKDKECTIPFDFTNAKNLYIELKDCDINPLYILLDKGFYGKIYTPYLPKTCSIVSDAVKTLSDITPNLSKYIPEGNAVLFLSEGDKVNYSKSLLTKENSSYMVAEFDNFILCSYDKQFPKNYKHATIFLHYGTQAELQKAVEVAKELKEKYGVEEVNLFVLHFFVQEFDVQDYWDDQGKQIYEFVINPKLHRHNKDFIFLQELNKIITTNSTGILPVQDEEHLQVINCKEIFEEYLKTER